MNSIKTSIARLTLIDKNIIHLKFDDHVDFEVKEMLEIRKASQSLCKKEDYCVLMETGAFTNFTKEAMKASASPEHTKGRIALAILRNNLAMSLIANFYMTFNKPVGLTKAFKSKAKAIAWLEKVRDKHYSRSICK